jgi:hypothetical protein
MRYAYMPKQSSTVVPLTPGRAALRLRQLLDEVQMLIGAFPDLRDAFDPDELPLAFILKRDSGGSEREPEGTGRRSAPVGDAVGRRRARTARPHAGRRKQPSND